MKVTFEEVVSGKTWLQNELLNSLDGDTITKARNDGFYDVKLLVNGVELEPQLFNKIMDGIASYIDAQAKSLVKEKLENAENKARKLESLIIEASNKIQEEFDLNVDEL